MSLIRILSSSNSGLRAIVVSNNEEVVVSHAKNVRNLSGESLGIQDYGAFGSFTNGLQDLRWGTGHLTGGKYYNRLLNESTLEFSSWQLLFEYDYNLEDIYSHQADGIIVSHFSASDNNFNGNGWDTRLCAYFIRDLSGNIISGPHETINGSSGVTGLQRAWPFGRGGYLGSPGCYGQTFVSYTLQAPDYITISDGKLFFHRTTDNWQTFEAFEFYSGTNVDETILIPCDDGRAVAIRRQSGKSWMYKCADTLAATPSWTNFGTINLGWMMQSTTIIPTYDIHDGLYDIVFANRGTGMICISRNNTFDDIYNGIFNEEEIIAYASVDSSGSIYKPLGYPVFQYNCGPSSFGGTLSFVGWSRETVWSGGGDSPGKAEFWGTFLDFEHDETGAPATPPSLTEFAPATTANAFQVDITGYTEAEIANIKWFIWDVSTDPDFSPGTFITKSVEWAQPAVLIQDLRIPSLSIAITSGLTTSTTYYIRAKAVNHQGESSYTSTSVTTS